MEGGFIIGFWILLVFLTVGQRALDRFGPEGLVSGEIMQAVIEYGLWALVTPFVFFLSRRFSLDHARWPKNLASHALVALCFAVFFDFFGWISYQLLVHGEWRYYPIIDSLITFRFIDELFIYLFVLSAGFARVYFLRYRTRLEEAIRLQTQTTQLQAETVQLQAQLTEARLQALRMQVNPHFLFNTLNAVSALVERDPRGVRRMIARLSELLRHALEDSNTQEVPLRDELDFLRRYLEIQQIRFQGRLEVTEEIPPELNDTLVPNLILQPLVENAIKHGASTVDDTGRIAIRAWREENRLCLSVEDNGNSTSGSTLPNLDEGVGLKNTRARLEQLYGHVQQLTYRLTDSGGLIVQVSLPYHQEGDLVTHAITE